jgi:hypothetical protein
MSSTYSYIKMDYGRYRGQVSVTRFCRIDNDGRIAYVEKRADDKGENILWRIGNIKFINFSQHKTCSSSEEEYNSNLEQAIKSIQ